MKRTLRLHSERLAELTPDALAHVAAGVTLTGYYPTLNAPCPTVQECLAPLFTLDRPCPTLDGCFTGTTTTS